MTTHKEGMYGELPTLPCIFSACDSHYFMEHASAFIYSADKVDKPVHIHVINPTPQVLALSGILNATTKTNVTYTFHDADVPEDKDARRTLYACIRFLVLPQIVRSAKKVLTLDIDCMVMQPFDFPNKPAGYFPRESMGYGNQEREGTKVAAGAVYLTEDVLGIVDQIHNTIKTVPMQWYADQIVLHRVFKQVPESLVAKFDGSFMDWEFRQGTTIWTGKGPRKYENPIYVSMKQKMGDINTKLNGYQNVILKPRLDIPFKRSGLRLRNSTNEPIREHWANFVNTMTDTLDNPLVIEMPRWMFNSEILSYFPRGTPMLVPHEEKHSWGGDENTRFYMQTVFPWLFTIDPEGWGGGAKFIQTFENIKGDVDTSFFDELSDYTKRGGTKFGHLQPKKGFRHGNLLEDEFIFVPLQIPHDLVIKYHSQVSCEEFVRALCEWADQKGNPQVVFKGHPINVNSMSPLINIIRQHNNAIYLTDCHIHEMIDKAKATYVINSGTGQEAMLLDKTVVAFGRCEYLKAVIAGNIENLDEAWKLVKNTDQREQQETYRHWYGWYSKNVFDSR